MDEIKKFILMKLKIKKSLSNVWTNAGFEQS